MPGLQRITGRDLAAHRVTVPGTQDEIYSPLYDSVAYTTAVTTSAVFFAVPIGQGTTTAPGAAGPKTEADTNLTNAGLLPKGNRFLCVGVEFQLFPGVNPGRGGVADATAGQFVNDVYLMTKSAWARLRIQNRDFLLDGPILNFPPVARLAGFTGSATDLTTGAATYSEVSYAAAGGQPYSIVPVYIESNQAFSLTLTWPAAVTLFSATNMRIFARLRGRLIRDAQ